jgi:DHA2 family multidrug resistance protein-like MFS transporter
VSGTPQSKEEVMKATRREWLGLAVLCLPTLLVPVDISVLFLAIPQIGADLGAGGTAQLWITDIYGFMLAGFLITMGALGDRMGRRRVLLWGAAVFALASLAAAYAPSAATLIGARAVLGVAAATLMPSVLGLIRDMFRDAKELAAAMGLWGTTIILGVVLGPAIGGLMLEAFWWGSVFLMGLPVMALLLLAGPPLLPASRPGPPTRPAGASAPAGTIRLDLVSVALSLAAILPVVYGLKEIARGGWAPPPVAFILIGMGVAAVFVVRQGRLAHPLVDLRLVTHRTFGPALLLALVLGFVMASIGLTATLYMQMVEGLSPLQVGLWLLPPSLAMFAAGNLGPAMARRVPPAHVMAGGLLLAAAGSVLLTQVGRSSAFAVLVLALMIVYIGSGPTGVMTNFLTMSSAPPEKAAAAGGLSTTGGELGVALGVAVMGSVGTAVYRAEMTVPDGAPPGAGDSIAGAVAAAGQMPGPAGADLLAAARDAFTESMHTTAVILALLFAGLAAYTIARLRHVSPTAVQPPEPDTSPDASQTREMVDIP